LFSDERDAELALLKKALQDIRLVAETQGIADILQVTFLF
jgi:hypothetical protein